MAGARKEVPCKVVCWRYPSSTVEALLPPFDRQLQAMDLVQASDLAQTYKDLGRPGEAILLLEGFPASVSEAIRGLRMGLEWADLPIFAAVPGTQIDAHLREEAEARQVELLPMPIPAGRFWARLREAGAQYRAKQYKTRLNRRRYFRVPLSVSALCLIDAHTVDICMGGILLQTNHPYTAGARGRIDIPWLHETIGEALAFQVVAVEPLRKGEFQYLIRAKFVDLSPEALEKLGQALSILEPGSWKAEK